MFRHSSLALLAGSLALLCLCGPVGGQSDDEGASAPISAFTEAVDVRVVNIETFVTDKAGNPVPGLTREDFELLVDGERVEITNFYGEVGNRPSVVERAVERDSERQGDASFHPIDPAETAPDRRLYLVVFVDNSRLKASNRKRALAAVEEAVGELLAPDDLVSVVSFGRTMVFHSDFLFDRGAIGDILSEVSQVSARSTEQRLERRQIISELTRGQTGGILGRTTTSNLFAEQALARIRAYAGEQHAQALQSLRQIEHLVATIGGLPGRKAVLYVSDGIPNRPGEDLFNEYVNRTGEGNPDANPGLRRIDFNSDYMRDVGRYDLMKDVEQLGSKANQAGVTIYALDAESDHGGELRSAATEQGAISTTLSIAIDNVREPLELAARATGGRRIQASGRLNENLARLASDFGTFYSLGFSPAVWDPGATHDIKVRLRDKKLVARHREELLVPDIDEQAAQRTVSTLLYQGVENPLGISLHPGSPTPRGDGTSALTVLVDIPVKGLSLLPSGEAHSARITFFVSVKDKGGNPGAVQKVPFHLQIPSDKVAEALAQSAHYPLPVVLRAGDRQVAIAVRDEASALLSALRLDVAEFSPSL